ncbi:MAG TPA: pyridoxal-phosphate dependent enzyme, partial [Tenuifilaceae bacterium]|nr:pyridoxal-phosphate dependent enzyme [Tenuifilaceae bacterium]
MTRNNIIGVPTITDIEEAYERINGQVKRTPVLSSESINRILGAQIFFKCENFQKVGAFKFRGASNAVLSLSEQEAAKGVATHSSGNHAAALALAAALRGIPAHVVMPNNSPLIKRRAVEGYGARITYCNPTQQDREETLAKVQMRTGSAFVHPYDNTRVICGQGTAAMELLQEVNNLNTVIVPIGGGGLMSGTAIYVKG